MNEDVIYRVLAHLPPWTDDEEALLREEGPNSIRAYQLDTFAARLAEDPSTPAMSEAEVAAYLKALASRHHAVLGVDGWRMTEAGFRFLTAPDQVRQHETAATIHLNPAKGSLNVGI